MTELMRGWVIGITGMSLITSVVMAIVPKGRVRKTVSLVCGMGMIVVLVSPVLNFDYDTFAQYISGYAYETDLPGKNMDEENERLTRLIIQEEVNAYILDKAQSIGFVDAKVSTQTKMDGEGAWYPWEVTIEGSFTSEQQRLELQNTIEGDIGVPPDRQYWSTKDE